MLNYKNIIFDFGNVIGTFNEDFILHQFCQDEKDIIILKKAVFHNWPALDNGTADYKEAEKKALSMVPGHLRKTVEDFYLNWHRHLTPINEVWTLIRELRQLGIPLYILSNAPTHFAEHADYYEITKEFTGVLFSAPLKLSKPDPEFYRYLLSTYSLKPEECLFIDDKKENIEAAKNLGMDGIIFTGDIRSIKIALGMVR